MLDEDKTYIRLFCHKCDNTDCSFWKKLGYITDIYEQGCSREVSFDDFSKYEHFINEVIPFWSVINNENLINEQYNEIIDFLNKSIFNKKIVSFFDKKGKKISFKEIDYVVE